MVDPGVDASGLAGPAGRPAKQIGVLAERLPCLRFIWLPQLREFMLPEYDLG
jgi:hypothetical protein